MTFCNDLYVDCMVTGGEGVSSGVFYNGILLIWEIHQILEILGENYTWIVQAFPVSFVYQTQYKPRPVEDASNAPKLDM